MKFSNKEDQKRYRMVLFINSTINDKVLARKIEQSIYNYIIEISKEFDGWYGGRIMGGGFGGSTIHILADDVIDSYSRYIVQSYCNNFGISPQVFPICFSGGLESLQ